MGNYQDQEKGNEKARWEIQQSLTRKRKKNGNRLLNLQKAQVNDLLNIYIKAEIFILKKR